MKADLREVIRRSRKSLSATQASPKAGRRRPAAASIAKVGHSPFNYKDSSKRGGVSDTLPYAWCQEALKRFGSARDRAIMAIRDAARAASRSGSRVDGSPFYVTGSIRKAWGLTPRDLSRAITHLASRGAISIKQRKRGRYARLVLNRQGQEG